MGKTKKLSESQNSKKYLENKYGVSSKPVSSKVQKDLESAGQLANERIKCNNSVYNQSNARSQECILMENSFCETSKESGLLETSEKELIEYKSQIGIPSVEENELIDSLIAPRLVLNKKE